MSNDRISDEVLDAIAHIEMHRQEAEKESGLAAACSDALRKLQELFEQEKAALEQNSPGVSNSANLNAVTNEINKVRKLSGGGNSDRPKQNKERHGQQPQPSNQRKGAPNQPRNKGRRTMGRRGDR
jgi:hypothetical protein